MVAWRPLENRARWRSLQNAPPLFECLRMSVVVSSSYILDILPPRHGEQFHRFAVGVVYIVDHAAEWDEGAVVATASRGEVLRVVVLMIILRARCVASTAKGAAGRSN